MPSFKYPIIIALSVVFFGIGIVLGISLQLRPTQITTPTIETDQEENGSLEFFYYQIPEIGLQFSMPTSLEGHVTHVYQERPDQSWLTEKEMSPEARYAGLEKCISRGERIKEVIFRYDVPFYYGDDEKGYTKLGSLTQLKNMGSDDCGTGKIGASYFVKGPDSKLYKYSSIWNGMGRFIMNKEQEPRLFPLFFIFDAYVGPSLRKID